MTFRIALCFALSAAIGLAQEPRRETVVVTGTYEPLALEEVDRAVTVLAARDAALLLNGLTDLLQTDPSLDLRQRAPGGIQGDLSIRGSSFGQTLVLLNGQRLNDAQSGHHNMDIPVPIETATRVEVMRGSGSTLYGSDAVGGVINVITEPPESPEIRIRAAAGNYGVNQQRLSLAGGLGKLSEQLVFSRDFSTGFQPDRDYRNLALASTSRLVSRLGPNGLTLAYQDRPFGADQFYGNYNSWERTKTWFASLQQALGERTSAAFSYRRHTDLFVLYRDRPSVFTNRHAAESYQASLRRKETIRKSVSIYYGAEAFHESVESANLGDHARSRAAAYASLDFRALGRFSLSLAAREEVYRRFSGQFSPTLAGGFWISRRLKARASASRAFRVPSYTDLYYHDPANVGSPDLRPERAWTYEAGLDWNAGPRLGGGATVFQRRERDGIDYVRYSLEEIWRARNIHNLRFTGLEASAHFIPAKGQTVEFRFTGLHGAQDALAGAFSKYVFNYPSQSGTASWQAALPGKILLRTRVGAVNRRARDPYALWDFCVARAGDRVRPFLQFSNLTAASYQEVAGVAMPGRTVLGGIELLLTRN